MPPTCSTCGLPITSGERCSACQITVALSERAARIIERAMSHATCERCGKLIWPPLSEACAELADDVCACAEDP